MKISGNINLPGDKSISHRALMFASLTDGECIINNISTGEDVETTRKCLGQCGVLSQKFVQTIGNLDRIFVEFQRLIHPMISECFLLRVLLLQGLH